MELLEYNFKGKILKDIYVYIYIMISVDFRSVFVVPVFEIQDLYNNVIDGSRGLKR